MAWSLARESYGALALPLFFGLFVVGEVWRRKAAAPAWPRLLVLALLVPPVLLCVLGGLWVDHGVGYGKWRTVVLLGLAVSELLLSFLCLRGGRRGWDIIPFIVGVALVWTLLSWIAAALSMSGDSL